LIFDFIAEYLRSPNQSLFDSWAYPGRTKLVGVAATSTLGRNREMRLPAKPTGRLPAFPLRSRQNRKEIGESRQLYRTEGKTSARSFEARFPFATAWLRRARFLAQPSSHIHPDSRRPIILKARQTAVCWLVIASHSKLAMFVIIQIYLIAPSDLRRFFCGRIDRRWLMEL
jgi:hypothetical protein